MHLCPGACHTHRDRRDRGRAGAGRGRTAADRLRTDRRPRVRRARSAGAGQRHHPGHRARERRRWQGALCGVVRHLQAGRRVEDQRPDVARRAQSRPRVSIRGAGARVGRRHAGQRLARRQRRRHRVARQGERGGTAVPAVAGGACARRRGDHRRGVRPHRQPIGAGIAAAAGADQPGAVPAGVARHDESAPGVARRREPARRGERRGGDRPERLGLGALRRQHAVSRCARRDADLPEARLRCRTAVPGGVHRSRPVRARHRLRRVARRRRVLQERAGRRSRHAQSDRAPRHAQHHARHLAVGQLPARLAAPRASTRTRAAAACTTACGRSSPAGASR